MSAHAVFYKKFRSKTNSFFVICILSISLVVSNIIFSQNYNKHMYGVMNGESRAIVSYLKHIWGTQLFNLEINQYSAESRSDVLSQWAQVQKVNRKRIQNLEEMSRLHPSSPELYYNLFLLYSEKGDKTKAQENLKKAQLIDPSIKEPKH